MRRLLYIYALVAVLSFALSCKRVPDYVIDPDDMAELMADIHTAESVVDMNHSAYSSDSTKLVLRQAIFLRHGISNEQFDTSLVWYGQNIDKYIEVYDNTIKILERREKDLGNAIVQQAVSISGDSVDVWPGARYAVLSKRMPSDMISFDLTADDNWKPGDVYTWRIKIIDDGIRSLKWNIFANYTDNTCEWLNSTTSSNGWNEMTFVADSTKTLSDLRGVVEAFVLSPIEQEEISANHDFWVDSISLVRKRANPEFYQQRTRLRSFKNL